MTECETGAVTKFMIHDGGLSNPPGFSIETNCFETTDRFVEQDMILHRFFEGTVDFDKYAKAA